MRKKKHEEHENMERWLVSYADFITLLFAFFVVMYSTSSVRDGKYRAVADSMSEAFNPIIAFSSSNVRLTSGRSGESAFSVDIRLYYKRLKKEVETSGLSGKVDVFEDGRGTVIRIAENQIFEVGEAAILPGFETHLDRIAEIISVLPYRIQVEGHTDNIPIQTPLYPSNWELSAARAAHLIRYFIERHKMDPERFSAVGYAEFRPIVSNDGPEGRRRNRRVEIVISDIHDADRSIVESPALLSLPEQKKETDP
ncbi:MAG: flagellar motor protein MotB [Candidatus Manganitrophaceae bacterium]